MATRKDTVKRRNVSWKAVANKANGPKRKETTYRFSNGREFKEPYNPQGFGVYEE